MNYEEYLNSTPKKRMTNFMNTLSITNKTPEYFINWIKVYRNTKKYEIHLNTLNYLVGKDNIEEEAFNLFQKQPKLLEAIPSLLANREDSTDFLIMEDNILTPKNLNFDKIDKDRLDEYIKFIDETGLLSFIQNKANMSLVDYVYGVESGLDSNARKNRSGSTMEKIVDSFIDEVSKQLDIEYMEQATANKIETMWNKKIPVDRSNRRFDFAIFNKRTNKLFLVETNYYNSGGSKLKAVAGEFSTLNKLIKSSEDSITFIWITDGQGWKTAKAPILEAFYDVDCIFNLKNLSDNFLENILNF